MAAMAFAEFLYDLETDAPRVWQVAADPFAVPRYINFARDTQSLGDLQPDGSRYLRVFIVYKRIFRGSPAIRHVSEPDRQRITLAHHGEGLIDFVLTGDLQPAAFGPGCRLALQCDYTVRNRALGWIAVRVLPRALQSVVSALDRFASQQPR